MDVAESTIIRGQVIRSSRLQLWISRAVRKAPALYFPVPAAGPKCTGKETLKARPAEQLPPLNTGRPGIVLQASQRFLSRDPDPDSGRHLPQSPLGTHCLLCEPNYISTSLPFCSLQIAHCYSEVLFSLYILLTQIILHSCTCLSFNTPTVEHQAPYFSSASQTLRISKPSTV